MANHLQIEQSPIMKLKKLIDIEDYIQAESFNLGDLETVTLEDNWKYRYLKIKILQRSMYY